MFGRELRSWSAILLVHRLGEMPIQSVTWISAGGPNSVDESYLEHFWFATRFAILWRLLRVRRLFTRSCRSCSKERRVPWLRSSIPRPVVVEELPIRPLEARPRRGHPSCN
jgi:hypothetical protein